MQQEMLTEYFESWRGQIDGFFGRTERLSILA